MGSKHSQSCLKGQHPVANASKGFLSFLTLKLFLILLFFFSFFCLKLKRIKLKRKGEEELSFQL